ncbi:hypothetical protein SAMN04244567_04110 [Paracoccus pantotrophus]|jgi:hypothetical protein|nr:hypothetical protein [Paracoccus denitrificans]GEK70205.1 hypothetical protein PDE01_37250 [Paracoccus denitrificans]SDI89336.1 hypothetical protein SAMN04244581_02655 [Paracoccus denitrificans]SFP27167.1 hypothetical protein SAMN04244567_04110 [Paracoccus pantotrophus]SFR09423.1 hypothetical protein SAMN04244569_02501 [Paracoccus denitrificans]
MRTGLLIVLLAIAPLAACDESSGYDDYDGCHGVGCLVDNPDDPDNWPICSDGAQRQDCRNAPLGY